MPRANASRPCKNCGIYNSTKPHGLCPACFLDWTTAREIERTGLPVPDDLRAKLMIQELGAGWQLLMADNALRWRPIGKPFAQESAAENAGRIVVAAAKLLQP
jgi:hypothetical protein